MNASFVDENGNITNNDLVNDSSLLIDEIGKNIGFNNSKNKEFPLISHH